MEQPLVSVVIPVFNIEAHLEQCLDSVVGQTLQEIEVICVDDGSTDSSPRILERYAQQDARVQVITQANAGPGVARNTGLAEAAGRYLIFLDSDDWFEPDFLEQMVERAEETGADVTICRAVEFDTSTGRELPPEWMLKSQYLPGETFSPWDIADHIFQFTYGWPWDKLCRLDFVRKTGLTYPVLPNSEDLVFVFQSLVLAGRIAINQKILVHHRVNRTASVSNSRHRDPQVPHEALRQLKNGLMARGIYEAYEKSFLNWAMEFLVWSVAGLADRPVQQQYFKKLKQEWLPEMNFEVLPIREYDRSIFCKYLLAKWAPWPVFYGVLKGWHRWKGEK